MNTSIYTIPTLNLLLIILPVFVVIFFYMRWALSVGTVVYAIARMTGQLLLIGYVLVFVFQQKSVLISTGILFFMLFVASWISLRPLKQLRVQYYYKALLSIAIGAFPVLILVVFGVIRLNPWYLPKYLIPLAGMIFANSMNSVSLCADRFHAEIQDGKSFEQARNHAYRTSLLPLINSFFAVGLVSLPGMMTGQILAGVSPLIAVRY
ncbi:Probable iron export permease protein FetB, partial [hydrothermal vent metagenome]